MNFAVRVVPDSALPAGIEQVMVERQGQAPLLLLTESVARVWSFVSDWADDIEAERGRDAPYRLHALASV